MSVRVCPLRLSNALRPLHVPCYQEKGEKSTEAMQEISPLLEIPPALQPEAKPISNIVEASSLIKAEGHAAIDFSMTEMILRAQVAADLFATFTQDQVDVIFKAAALAANGARVPLAKMAVKETRMGVMEDKIIKNHFASEFVYHKYRGLKTCGEIEVDEAAGMTKIYEPVGIVLGVVPCTNPTSTAIFKSLLTLKTRNALILCPHPRAKESTIAAAKIVLDAAVAAGAPPGIITWVEHPSSAISNSLMLAPQISLILATGGPGMVHAAYSSGHPSLGVGAGNTPVVIDETADVDMAVSSILLSKTFDNGVICASEQSIIVLDSIYSQVKEAFERRGGEFLSFEQREKVRSKLMVDGHMNHEIVGQSVERLAQIFDITVPVGTRMLIAEVQEIGASEPFSLEKLCPLLALYPAKDLDSAIQKAEELVLGSGHTSVLYSTSKDNIKAFSRLKTVRVLVNTPSSQGAIGDLYNFHLDPSLTLGCGSWGSNSVSSNVGPLNLVNTKMVIERRQNMQWLRIPPKVYHGIGCLETALMDLRGMKRALVITDQSLMELGYVEKVTKTLDLISCHHSIFYHVEPEPSLETVEAGLLEANSYQPDVIIGLGGGSPMDVAKVIWLMYERPGISFKGLSLRFMDIRKRVFEIDEGSDSKAKSLLVCIPTTSGTGSEVTPFAVLGGASDSSASLHQKYPLADYHLTPSMAIIDPLLVLNLPKRVTAHGGIDALTHCLESYVSTFSTEFTRGLSTEATLLLFKWLPIAYEKGARSLTAREKVHNAASIAGLSFGNAFLGICHSIAHKLGARFNIPHGLANAALISHVIRFNATDRPFKMASFPLYESPHALHDYAQLADALALGGSSEDEKVLSLIKAIEDLKVKLDIPPSLSQIIKISYEEYEEALDELSEAAWDDQCTGTNPRFPLISDLKQIMKDAWEPFVFPQA